ncbi:MAG: FixH family protein [Pseudomonadales bacterium]|nr:FixH family protein [Pseudomonadales bacterium]
MRRSHNTTSYWATPFPIILALLGLFLLGACGQGAGTDTVAMTNAAKIKAAAPGMRATGRAGRYALHIVQPAQQIVVSTGAFQQWQVRIHNAAGSGVHPARISLDGGMPGHGHGLPSQPRVTRHLGDGVYLVEGLKFHMAGSWQLRFRVDAQAGRDLIELNFDVSY